ncbi:MAG: tyrosine-type recombinase/integrase [Lachnospiraceae bacterium]|nr:tyrosine-type recombinase/integrase [Lachnospiraceae bacterium]
MGTTQPIKSMKELDDLKNFYLTKKPNLRNYALICTGVNTALRISDILGLTWEDVYDFHAKAFRNHIIIYEKKTGKQNMIASNKSMIHGLQLYMDSLCSVCPSHFIFAGRNATLPLSRVQAFRIIKEACSQLHLPDNISCHSLRKTFGYHAWVSGVSPAILMIIYNHSSFQVTKRYLGIEQEDKDKVFLSLNL